MILCLTCFHASVISKFAAQVAYSEPLLRQLKELLAASPEALSPLGIDWLLMNLKCVN
jgi:hypothetical protein